MSEQKSEKDENFDLRHGSFAERLEFVQRDVIKKSGSMPLGFWKQAIAIAGFNPVEEMELMQATISSEELSDDYKDIFSTTSIIGGLIIAFCFSATQTRLTPTSTVTTIWGNDVNIPIVVDFYGLIIALALISSFLAITYSTFLSIMMAQIPKNATTRFFEYLGPARFQVVFLMMTITLNLFAIATVLQISLNYSKWVSIVTITVLLLLVVFSTISTGSIQVVRMEVLRVTFEKLLKENSVEPFEKKRDTGAHSFGMRSSSFTKSPINSEIDGPL